MPLGVSPNLALRLLGTRASACPRRWKPTGLGRRRSVRAMPGVEFWSVPFRQGLNAPRGRWTRAFGSRIFNPLRWRPPAGGTLACPGPPGRFQPRPAAPAEPSPPGLRPVLQGTRPGPPRRRPEGHRRTLPARPPPPPARSPAGRPPRWWGEFKYAGGLNAGDKFGPRFFRVLIWRGFGAACPGIDAGLSPFSNRHPGPCARDPSVRRKGGGVARRRARVLHVRAEPGVPGTRPGMTAPKNKPPAAPDLPGRAKPYISWRLQRAGRDGLVKDGAQAVKLCFCSGGEHLKIGADKCVRFKQQLFEISMIIF